MRVFDFLTSAIVGLVAGFIVATFLVAILPFSGLGVGLAQLAGLVVMVWVGRFAYRRGDPERRAQ